MTLSPHAVPNRGPTFVAVTAVITSVDFALVVFRLMWRSMVQGAVGMDDVFVGLAMAAQILITVLGDTACHYSFGRHLKDVRRTGGNAVLGLKYFWLFQIFYKITICLNKLSFISLYLRLFPSKKFRTLCHVTTAIVVGGTFSFVIATIFQCTPVRASWHKHIPKKCVENTPFRWSWAAYNTASDIWIYLMPMPLLARLHLDRARKIGLMFIFSLGLFVCVTSIIRMVYIAVSTKTHDPTWGSWPALLWSAIEPGTGIICSCLPFLKHPIQRAFPGFFSSTIGGSASASGKTRSRPTYGALSGNGGGRSKPQTPYDGGNHWSRIGSARRNSTESREPIADDQILMKMDFEMQSQFVRT